MGIQLNGNNDNISAVDGDLSITGIVTFSQLDVGSNIKLGNAGVITATSFVGSGANLTGITGTTINNNATTKFITGTNNANELDCEANLSYNNNLVTFASSNLLVNKSTSPTISVTETAGNKSGAFRANTDGVLLRSLGNYPLIFHTNQTERAQIDGSGRFLIGTNGVFNANSYSNNLIVYENGDVGMSIIGNNSNSNYASLYLSDTSTASRAYLEAQLGANGNFTIGSSTNGPIRFVAGGLERLRITSAGRVGIGEESPDGMLHLKGGTPAIFLEDTSGTHGQTIIEQNNDNLKIRCDAGNASSGTGSNIRFEVDATERLRIQSNNGDILFGNYLGTTNQPRVFFLDPTGNFPDQSNRIGLRISNGYNDASIRAYSNNDGWSHVKFYSTHLSGGTIVTSGSITQSGGNSISYNQASDYRLKENEVLISDGITRLKQLKPYRFNWKTDTSKKVDGFYAHEVSGIVPEAVTGEKDAVVTQAMIDAGEIDEAIGNPVYQQMDFAKLVPLITAALQETVAKIETLETKVETLEQDNELLRKKVLENVVRIVNLENDSHEH